MGSLVLFTSQADPIWNRPVCELWSLLWCLSSPALRCEFHPTEIKGPRDCFSAFVSDDRKGRKPKRKEASLSSQDQAHSCPFLCPDVSTELLCPARGPREPPSEGRLQHTAPHRDQEAHRGNPHSPSAAPSFCTESPRPPQMSGTLKSLTFKDHEEFHWSKPP